MQICTVSMQARELVNVPRLFLQNEMGLHEELDPQPQSTGRRVIHLLADAVPQIQPQVLPFAACELQPKVVRLNYAQLSANLERVERYESQRWIFNKEIQIGFSNWEGKSIMGHHFSQQDCTTSRRVLEQDKTPYWLWSASGEC